MGKERLMAAAVMVVTIASSHAADAESSSVIDMHCHFAGIGAKGSGCFVADRLRKSWKYGIFLKAFGVTEEDLLREGDGLVLKRLSDSLGESVSVSYAVVLGLDGVVNEAGELDREKTEMYIPNEFIVSEIGKYPNLLYGAGINPYRRDAIERLEQAARDGAVLVKWLPPVQNIDPADERLVPFYEKMKELNLPLLTHTGEERTFTQSHDELGDPERLRLPLSLGVTVIAAHSACSGYTQGEPNFDRLLRLCKEYPNLYADISSLTQANRLGKLRKVLSRPELRGRLLYGTDMPLINTAIVSPALFPFKLSLRQIVTIGGIENPWDRDVALKKALGMEDAILTRAIDVLRLDGLVTQATAFSTTQGIVCPGGLR